MKQLRPLILIIVLLAAVAYIGGIIWAGIASVKMVEEPTIPEIVTLAITVIGGALATHFGAICGISRFAGDQTNPPPPVWKVNTWARSPQRAGEPTQPLDTAQVIAAYLYFFSLVLAIIFWGVDGFSPNSAKVLSNMSFTFIGVLAGVIAIVLNIEPQK
jgi:hypothetical protein